MPRALTISFGFVSEFAVNGSSQILTSARFHRFDISCLWKLMKMKSKSLLNEYREFRFHVVHQRMDADSSYTQRQFLFIDYIEISRWLSLYETHIPCKMCRVTTNYICFFSLYFFWRLLHAYVAWDTMCSRNEGRASDSRHSISHIFFSHLLFLFNLIAAETRIKLKLCCHFDGGHDFRSFRRIDSAFDWNAIWRVDHRRNRNIYSLAFDLTVH